MSRPVVDELPKDCALCGLTERDGRQLFTVTATSKSGKVVDRIVVCNFCADTMNLWVEDSEESEENHE